MSFFHVLTLILPVIIISAVGYLFSFFKKNDFRIVSDLIIYVTAPALFVVSLSTHHFLEGELLAIIFTACGVMLLSVLILVLLSKLYDFPTGMYIPVAFMNTGFIGFPIILMAYGMSGLARIIIYDVVNGILIYSIGIYLLTDKTKRFELFKTPVLYAAILGISLNYLHIRLPEALGVSLAMVGSTTIPLALILLGYKLGEAKIKKIKLPVIGTALRLFFGLSISLLIVNIFHIEGELRNILVISSAMPSALLGIVLSEKYKKEDSDVVASTIALSTLLSIIYIPLIITFLK